MQASAFDIRDGILESRETLLKVSFSSPRSDETEFKKIILRPIVIKGTPCWQAERFKDNKVFHANIPEKDVSAWLDGTVPSYVQISVFFSGETVTYSASKGNAYKKKTSANLMKESAKSTQNNREKDYILKEGANIPALVDLGVFTKDNKIVNSRYDKYKQINRFVELIDDAYAEYKGDDITILDFGCGRSYLTFIVYYYFTEIKKVNAKIIGYDLKADVVEECNRIAKKYGYDNLSFVLSDVSKDVLYDQRIDMIISLHACDTATDYALFYAIQKGVKNIFSVPCCQHQINSSIKKGGELDVFLKYGIIKERASALLTDAIRGMILEDMGYAVDMIEFVDLSHSPKNLMIRAKRTKGRAAKNLESIRELIGRYSIKQELFKLVSAADLYKE